MNDKPMSPLRKYKKTKRISRTAAQRKQARGSFYKPIKRKS